MIPRRAPMSLHRERTNHVFSQAIAPLAPCAAPRRSSAPLLESLEIRLVLSQVGVGPTQSIIGPVPQFPSGSPGLDSPTSVNQGVVGSTLAVKEVLGPNGTYIPDATASPSGYTPQQLQDA